jgi:hypothetical protein
VDEDQSSVGPRWAKWVNRFDNFLAALNITDDARRKALILHYGGEHVFEIFDTLNSNIRVKTPATAGVAAVNETIYEAARRALNDHFTPRVNTDFEMFTFRQLRQLEGESFDAFHTRLQQSAKNCGFTDKNREIKTQLPRLHLNRAQTKNIGKASYDTRRCTEQGKSPRSSSHSGKQNGNRNCSNSPIDAAQQTNSRSTELARPK